MTVAGCAEPLPAPPWHAGPLASPSDWCAGRRAEQGDAHCTAQATRRRVTPLSPWLQEQHGGAAALDEPGRGQLLPYRQPPGRAPRPHRVPLRTVLQAVRDAGLRPVPVWPQSARDRRAPAFDDSVTAVRGLARSTREPDLPMVRRFLQERCGTSPRGLPALGLHARTPLLLRQAAPGRPPHAPSLVSALRTLCRLLVQRGAMRADRAAALPAGAEGRLAPVPKALAPAQVPRR